MLEDLLTIHETAPFSLENIVDIARNTSSILNGIRNSDHLQIMEKPDGSHITNADIAANDYITQELTKISPTIPILSEENSLATVSSSAFWVIDPLDGTTDFIDGRNGFSVNIALIIQGEPFFGVVACPAHDSIYFSTFNGEAFKQIANEPPIPIKTRKNIKMHKLKVGFNAKSSPMKFYDKTRQVLSEKFNLTLPSSPEDVGDIIPHLLVAEGKLDAYLKLGRDETLRGSGGYAWDNAAPHAIVKAAGGGFVDLYNYFNNLKYPTGRQRQHGYAVIGDRDFRDKIFHNYLSLKK